MNNEHKIEFDSHFLKVKSNGHYFYAERKGVDSVAFILIDHFCEDGKKWGLTREFKPPINDYLITAFGGSVDKTTSLTQIVIDEVKEEAGFIVREDDVAYVGKTLCSTQMNQFAHLYAVFVDIKNLKARTTEDHIEKLSSTVWMHRDEVLRNSDWKSITIMTKYLAQLFEKRN